MTQERIQTRYTLNGPLASHAELEQAIARAIEAHKPDFFPLLERLVDVGDSRVKLSQKDPLRVVKVELDDAHTGGSHASVTNPTSPRAAGLSTNMTSTRPAWPFVSTGIS